MTPKEFKEKYPEYAHLEGNELWDMMQNVLLKSGTILVADPNRIPVFHPPVEIPNIGIVYIEDETKTEWIDKNNNKVRLVVCSDPFKEDAPLTTYKMGIFNLGSKEEES